MSTYKKIWQLLTVEQRRTSVRLLGLMLIGTVLETIGMGLVVPAVGLISEVDVGARYPILRPALAAMGHPSRERLVAAGMLVLVAVYAIKEAFLGLLAWRQARFAYATQAGLSERLFRGYLLQPWTFHLQRNSAQLIRNVTTEIGMFGVVIQIILTVITEGMVALGIWLLLLSVEPVGALLVVSAVGLAGFGFHRMTRMRLLRWGEARQLHEGLRIQHLQQGLGGAKEVKLLGREADFLARYNEHNLGMASVAERQLTLQQLPRLWLELMAITGLATLVIVMIRVGKPLDALLPTMGLFAAAAFRVIPSVNRVLGSIQSVRYSLPVVNTLHHEMSLLESAAPVQRGILLAFKVRLQMESVTYKYPSASVPAVKDVSLAIQHGESVGFIGGSGAGKSTLIDLILGLLTPDSGRVAVDGVDIRTNLRGWKDQIGYVPQSIFLTDDTLRRNVAFGLPNDRIDEAAVMRAVRAAQLEEFAASLPKGLDTVVGERGVRLSGGQRQRIGIARALYYDPAVLVLDEATSSLDLATEREVMQAVYALQGSKTLLIVAHRLSTVASCDRLYRVEDGQVVDAGEAGVVLEAVLQSGR